MNITSSDSLFLAWFQQFNSLVTAIGCINMFATLGCFKTIKLEQHSLLIKVFELWVTICVYNEFAQLHFDTFKAHDIYNIHIYFREPLFLWDIINLRIFLDWMVNIWWLKNHRYKGKCKINTNADVKDVIP